MEDGAMGVGSSLIYAPGTFAETDELVALVTEAGRCGGIYISHMRSEGDRLLAAIDELIEISRALRRAGRDLPPEGQRPAQLGQARRGDRADRGGPRGRPADHRRHVHLPRRLHRPGRRHAHLGAGRRRGEVDRAAEGPGHPRQGEGRDARRAGGLREPACATPAPRARCWSASRTRS